MSSSSVDEMFEEARAKGELHLYFGGHPHYFIPHDAADMPTNDGVNLAPVRGIAATDPTIREEVHAAWLRLAADPVYGWFVIFYFASTPYLSRISGKDWLPQEFVSQIAECLRANKAAYTKLKRWHGETLEDGCWGMVVGANDNLHSN